jgi:hypothetical protein
MEKHIYFTYGDRGSVVQFNIVDEDEFQAMLKENCYDIDVIENTNGYWQDEGILHYGKVYLKDYNYLIFVDPETDVKRHIFYTNENPDRFVYNKFIKRGFYNDDDEYVDNGNDDSDDDSNDNSDDDSDDDKKFTKKTILDEKYVDTLNMNKLYDTDLSYASRDSGVHVVNTSKPYPKLTSEWEMGGQQHSAVIFIHKLK